VELVVFVRSSGVVMMKKLVKSMSLLVLSSVVIAGCGIKINHPAGNSGTSAGSGRASGNALTLASRNPLPLLQESNDSGTFALSCGARSGNLEYQMNTPHGWNGRLFAMVLNHSPGIYYLSENLTGLISTLEASTNSNEVQIGSYLRTVEDPYQGIKRGLLSQGYRVIEVRYPASPRPCSPAMHEATGFYSLCCRQGLSAVADHNAALYDRLVHQLGYNPQNSEHRLVGFGVSLGAIQVQSMAFKSGKKFEKVGLSGVLMGDSEQGCRWGRTFANNGLSWRDFMHFADALTRTGDGCSNPRNMEYEAYQHNFRWLNYRSRWDLGMFEGSRRTSLPALSTLEDPIGLHGADAQVEAIQHARRAVDHASNGSVLQAEEAATTVHFYPNCGHDVLFCSRGEAVRDILQYFSPDRRGLDSGH